MLLSYGATLHRPTQMSFKKCLDYLHISVWHSFLHVTQVLNVRHFILFLCLCLSMVCFFPQKVHLSAPKRSKKRNNGCMCSAHILDVAENDRAWWCLFHDFIFFYSKVRSHRAFCLSRVCDHSPFFVLAVCAITARSEVLFPVYIECGTYPYPSITYYWGYGGLLEKV